MEKDAITVIIRKHLEKVQEAIKVNMDAYGRNASGRSVKSLNVKMVTYNHGWLEGRTAVAVSSLPAALHPS